MIYITEGCSLRGGIYEIVNKQTGLRYIGQAKEFKARWNQHRQALRNGNHQNKHLLGSYKKWVELLGHDDFIHFGIVEVMDDSTKEERNVREEWWINAACEHKIPLYNKRMEPTKQESKVTSHNLENTRSKLSLIRTGSGNGMFGKTPWNKGKKLPEYSGDNHGMFGKHHTDEAKAKMSAGHKGKSTWNKGQNLSEETRQKISEAGKGRTPWNKGKSATEESKQRQSEIMKGKMSGLKHPNAKVYENIKLLAPDGQIYTKIDCLKIFCDEHGLLSSGLLPVLQGKTKTYKGWILQKEE